MKQITLLSQLTLELDGKPLSDSEAISLGEVHVRQRLSAPALCELVFFDPQPEFENRATAGTGAQLRVAVKGREPELFSGRVSAVECGYEPGANRELRLRAYDPLHRLSRQRPVRAHVQITLAALARELAKEVGLNVEATADGPVWGRVIQHRQSNLELLMEIAEQCGLHFTVRGTTLHIYSFEGIGGTIPLVLGDSVFEARIEVNDHFSYRSIVAEGWDPWHAEARSGRAQRPRSGRTAAAQGLNQDVNGKERRLVNLPAQEDAQVEASAQAELDWSAAQEVVFRGVAEGDPRLRPGTPIHVEGVARPLQGRYVISAVDHVIDSNRGFLSELSTAPPARRRPARAFEGATAALGLVTRIEDPEKLGRVQVALPAFGGIETDWMEVLSAGAGAGKGLLLIPDVGDRVLVLGAHGDPAQGVVLGGLFGPKGPPEDALGGGGVQRFTLRTSGGQFIRIDDGERSLRLENQAGSSIELSPGKVRLHAESDLEIEAPGKSIVIRGAKVDFQSG